MNTSDLIEKSKKESLSSEELSFMIEALKEEMSELKARDPKQYLNLTKELNSITRDLNKELESI